MCEERAGVSQRRPARWRTAGRWFAALPDPLVGQIHRPHPVRGGWPDHGLGPAEKVAVQAGYRLDQLVAYLRGMACVLALPVRPPPVDLQAGCLCRVRGPAEAEPDQRVKLVHAGLGTVRVVVGERCPQLDGAQHQPGALQDPRQVSAEAQPEQPYRSHQQTKQAAQVVGHPHPVLQVGEAEGIEGPESVRRLPCSPTRCPWPYPSASLGNTRPSPEMHKRRVRRVASADPAQARLHLPSRMPVRAGPAAGPSRTVSGCAAMAGLAAGSRRRAAAGAAWCPGGRAACRGPG